MEHSTKVVYVIVGVLVVALASVAFFLQNTNRGQILSGGRDSFIGMANSNLGGSQSIMPNATSSAQEILQTKKTDMNNETQTNQAVPVKTITGAVITTSMGEIEVAFDAKNAPNTVANFVSLTIQKFYDGVKFHRVIKGFMIQVGDPNSKDDTKKNSWGQGGPGYKFNDELSGNETYPQGTVAMANAGPNTNGSQFFIVTASPSAPLPPSYTVFGHVVKGMDVAIKIENVKTELPGQADRPIEGVVVKKIDLK